MPKKITVEQLEKWLAVGEKLVKSPIATIVLAALAPLLPKAGFTPEQIAGMKARAADASDRERRARKRAGQA